MKQIKEMPNIEDNEVYQFLDKKLGQFRIGWISGSATILSIWLMYNTSGLIFGIFFAIFILNIIRLYNGK